MNRWHARRRVVALPVFLLVFTTYYTGAHAGVQSDQAYYLPLVVGVIGQVLTAAFMRWLRLRSFRAARVTTFALLFAVYIVLTLTRMHTMWAFAALGVLSGSVLGSAMGHWSDPTTSSGSRPS